MKKLILFSIVLGCVLASCVRTEKIDKFPLEKPKIVVNSFINNDEPMEFFLSKSLSSIDNAQIKKLPNAKILIYENGSLIETLVFESSNPVNSKDSYYVSKVKPKVGSTYNITISSPNLPSVTSAAQLPEALVNVTAKGEKFDTSIMDWYYYQRNADSTKYMVSFKSGSIIISIPDQPKVKNYYKITLFAEEKYWDGSAWDYRQRNIFINTEGVNYDKYDNGLFLSDNLYDGKNIPIRLDITGQYILTADPTVKFTVIVSNQSEAKQKYDISLGQYYQNQGNPFVEPTLVYTNILGGYGIFAGESELEIIVK